MADVCIVCEAFLQTCLEIFLCDECRKPAETSSLEEESAIDEGVEDTSLNYGFSQLQIMKFQKAELTRTSCVKRKLIF